MGEARRDALEVAAAIARRVLEGARIDLVDDAAAPPFGSLPGIVASHHGPFLLRDLAARRSIMKLTLRPGSGRARSTCCASIAGRHSNPSRGGKEKTHWRRSPLIATA